MHTYEPRCRFDHNRVVCKKSRKAGFFMPTDVSALQLVLTADPALIAIVRLSLIVSLSAVLLAALIGVPFGAFLALVRFPGREAVIGVLNALMGLPPAVVGPVGLVRRARGGASWSWGVLFDPQAVVVAESVSIARRVAAFTWTPVEGVSRACRPALAAMDVGPFWRWTSPVWVGRLSLDA